MISVEALREMFEYDYWARDRQLHACAALDQEKFQRPMGSSYSSLRDTLWHLLVAEKVWLDRWVGRSPQNPADAEVYYKEVLATLAREKLDTPAAFERPWRAVEHETRAYLDGLREDALPQPLTYINIKGQTWSYALWRTLVHVVNHQSYHRGQVTTLFRQLGAEPPAVDFLVAHDVMFQR